MPPFISSPLLLRLLHFAILIILLPPAWYFIDCIYLLSLLQLRLILSYCWLVIFIFASFYAFFFRAIFSSFCFITFLLWAWYCHFIAAHFSSDFIFAAITDTRCLMFLHFHYLFLRHFSRRRFIAFVFFLRHIRSSFIFRFITYLIILYYLFIFAIYFHCFRYAASCFSLIFSWLALRHYFHA